MSVESGSYYTGAMQTSTEKESSDNIQDCNNQQQKSSSSCILLSPAHPLRTFAISFLTHWIYSVVIIATISAFLSASVYCNLWREKKIDHGATQLSSRDWSTSSQCAFLHWIRRILFIVILLEIIIKVIARGLLVGTLSYLRIAWDWLDVISLVSLFVSIIFPWTALESLAVGIVLLKLIPIHPGSISAFISLCSCAKKLIPVLIYGIITVWIYGIVIFTLFVKYQQDIIDEVDTRSVLLSVTKTNESDSDSVENQNNTQESHVAAFADVDYLSPSTSKKSHNFSFGLSVECLPTNLRSLSGSLIQASQMLTLGFPLSDIVSTQLWGNVSNQNTLESLCQYEIYTLFIVETLVIISGTLPMIIITFGALYDFFQKESYDMKKLSFNHDDNFNGEHDSSRHPYYHHHRRSTVGSGISGRSTNSQSQNYRDEGSSRLSSSFKQLANICCDCDYYFCCLANLQLRLNPYAARILNSRRYKVCVLLVVSLDFLCMITLLWFSNTRGEDIDFSSTWLITYCLKICFGIYTLEAVFRWFAISSDEYWMNMWSAFDLIMVIVYWIGYIVLHISWKFDSYYPHFCGILIIRMLKVVPYWKSLEESLNLMMFSLLGKLNNLFVIFICSCSTFYLKQAVHVIERENQKSSQDSPNVMSSNTLSFYTKVEPLWLLVLYFFFFTIILSIFRETIQLLETRPKEQHVNPSISFLFNENPSEELVNMQCQAPPRNLNESSSPVSIMSLPNGISPMKYRFASTPNGSHNGLLLQERQNFLTPCSDVLSPLLSVPNESNGHLQNVCTPVDDINGCSIAEPNVQLNNNRRHTSQSLQFLFCSSKEQIFNILSSGMIILSAVNVVSNVAFLMNILLIVLDSSDVQHTMSWNSLHPGQSLWVEIMFIFCITAHIIYKTRLSRFSRETFIQISCIFDLLIILAASVEVFGSGMKWFSLQTGPTSVKVFVNFAKVISSCRGVLLLSRLSCLQDVGNCFCKLFRKCGQYLASFGYIWLIFILTSIEAQKMVLSVKNSMDKSNETLQANQSIRTVSNKIENYEGNFIPHSSLIVLTILIFLITFGVFLGLLVHNIGSWNEIINKYFCVEVRFRSFLSTGQHGMFSTYTEAQLKPTEGVCVPVLNFVANHPNFDIVVLVIILIDGLIISMEHLAQSERALILRKHYPGYIIFLYLMELSAKLAGNGLRFFKSNWNVLDFVIILISAADYIISLIINHYVPVLILNVRFLRVLRIFQFKPLVQRANILQTFFFIISKVSPILCTFGAFYFCLYVTTIIFRLRCMHFIHMTHNAVIWIAAPFQVLNAEIIFEAIGNLKLSNFTFESILFFSCIIFFSAIRISVIFCTCLVVVATLCQFIIMQQKKAQMEVTRLQRLHNSRDDADESVDYDDKYSYLPCASPDANIETPSSSGTHSRIHNNNSSNVISSCMDIEHPGNVRDIPDSSLYKTTTITSSEEINGCKVFYVEAMITTV